MVKLIVVAMIYEDILLTNLDAFVKINVLCYFVYNLADGYIV